jgi:hypothetical protein
VYYLRLGSGEAGSIVVYLNLVSGETGVDSFADILSDIFQLARRSGEKKKEEKEWI